MAEGLTFAPIDLLNYDATGRQQADALVEQILAEQGDPSTLNAGIAAPQAGEPTRNAVGELLANLPQQESRVATRGLAHAANCTRPKCLPGDPQSCAEPGASLPHAWIPEAIRLDRLSK